MKEAQRRPQLPWLREFLHARSRDRWRAARPEGRVRVGLAPEPPRNLLSRSSPACPPGPAACGPRGQWDRQSPRYPARGNNQRSERRTQEWDHFVPSQPREVSWLAPALSIPGSLARLGISAGAPAPLMPAKRLNLATLGMTNPKSSFDS